MASAAGGSAAGNGALERDAQTGELDSARAGGTGRTGSACGPCPVVAVTSSTRFDSLLERLGIERTLRAPARADVWVLTETDSGLELRPPGESGRAGIRARFPPDAMPRGDRTPPRSTLARSFGRGIQQILDGTAGLGADAYRLAWAGYEVCACERHPVVHALAASAWIQACESGAVPAPVAERLRFEWGDARERLGATGAEGLGVYLDPMYPPVRRRSALPKRALQVLRRLVGGDADVAEVAMEARERASRLVVKRPRHAAPLIDGVDFELGSKLVRFDVYLGSVRAGDPG